MSFASSIAALGRGVVVAAVTSAAALGLVAVLHPFPSAPVAISGSSAAADALHEQIDALRASIRAAEAGDAAPAAVIKVTPAIAADPQLALQLAAAAERRDLATQRATAIRAALSEHQSIGALAGIRDSAIVGQLLAQQVALEAEIAEQSARLRPTHPTMRALLAQRTALASQLGSEAASIASALEAEARSDEAQITLLRQQLEARPPAEAEASASPVAASSALDADRARLDQLMDAYLALRPTAATVARAEDDLLSLSNLAVIAAAGIGAFLFQLLVAGRRRTLAGAHDADAWVADIDVEGPEPIAVGTLGTAPLRRAS